MGMIGRGCATAASAVIKMFEATLSHRLQGTLTHAVGAEGKAKVVLDICRIEKRKPAQAGLPSYIQPIRSTFSASAVVEEIDQVYQRMPGGEVPKGDVAVVPFQLGLWIGACGDQER